MSIVVVCQKTTHRTWWDNNIFFDDNVISHNRSLADRASWFDIWPTLNDCIRNNTIRFNNYILLNYRILNFNVFTKIAAFSDNRIANFTFVCNLSFLSDHGIIVNSSWHRNLRTLINVNIGHLKFVICVQIDSFFINYDRIYFSRQDILWNLFIQSWVGDSSEVASLFLNFIHSDTVFDDFRFPKPVDKTVFQSLLVKVIAKQVQNLLVAYGDFGVDQILDYLQGCPFSVAIIHSNWKLRLLFMSWSPIAFSEHNTLIINLNAWINFLLLFVVNTLIFVYFFSLPINQQA